MMTFAVLFISFIILVIILDIILTIKNIDDYKQQLNDDVRDKYKAMLETNELDEE